MTAAAAIGAAFGAGLALVAAGLRPARVPLARAIAATLPTAKPSPSSSAFVRILGDCWADTPVGRRLAAGIAADLAITGTTPAAHLARRTALAGVGLLWAPATAALMAVGGVRIGGTTCGWLSLALAPLGFCYPSLALRAAAADRRRSFRHALSAFLDVVSISLAGGRGVDSAIHDAVTAGNGPAFAQIQAALLEARLTGDTAWAGLARLGIDIGVPELCELAASVSLAGSEGARVRSSLAAKARTLRLRTLTDIEAAAQAASERMSMPVVALMLGFIVFVAYPAVDRVLTGL